MEAHRFAIVHRFGKGAVLFVFATDPHVYYQPSVVLVVCVVLLVFSHFSQKSFSKFFATIRGGHPSIILRIFAAITMLRRHDKLRTRDNMA